MTMRSIRLCAVVAAALAGPACTINQTEAPGLTGPSTFGTSVTVSATPDTLVLNGQQSVVIVEAHDASGGPLADLRVHLDIAAGDVLANCGRLSLTDVTTGSDGRAAVVFTAPSLPLPMPECAAGSSGVTIVATPVGTNALVNNLTSAGIRFLTPGTVEAPSVFAVNFAIAPNPGTAGALIAFYDAGSVSPGHSIVSYRWTFSDGHIENGASITHDFDAPGVYSATLTITDDIGQSGSKTALVTIR